MKFKITLLIVLVISSLIAILSGFIIPPKDDLSKYTKVFNDNFDSGLKDFWLANEFVDSTRYGIVEDPLNKDNKVLRIDLKVGDVMAGAGRSEIKIKKKIDSFGYKNSLSFKFLIPDSFYAKEKKFGRIVIQQWHNRTYPGFYWDTDKNKAGPPEGLYFEHNEKGEWRLIFKSGLKVGNIQEVELGELKSIQPGVWHEFKLTTFWSLYDDGYFIASLDDKCFLYKGSPKCKIKGKNMYHVNPSYFKMGLYWSGSQINDRHIYFDDFKMTTGRVDYFSKLNN